MTGRMAAAHSSTRTAVRPIRLPGMAGCPDELEGKALIVLLECLKDMSGRGQAHPLRQIEYDAAY